MHFSQEILLHFEQKHSDQVKTHILKYILSLSVVEPSIELMEYIGPIVPIINYIKLLCKYPVACDCLLGCLRPWIPAMCNILWTRSHIFHISEMLRCYPGEIQSKSSLGSKSHFPLVRQGFGWWLLTCFLARLQGATRLQLWKSGVSL